MVTYEHAEQFASHSCTPVLSIPLVVLGDRYGTGCHAILQSHSALMPGLHCHLGMLV